MHVFLLIQFFIYFLCIYFVVYTVFINVNFGFKIIFDLSQIFVRVEKDSNIILNEQKIKQLIKYLV